MNKQELDEKIERIEKSGDPDAAGRIKILRDNFKRQQDEQAARAAQEQQTAEAQLKDRTRDAFMRNPAATLEAFEESWPGLKLRILADEAVKGEAAMRAQQAHATRKAF